MTVHAMQRRRMQVLLGSTTHLWSEVEMQQNEANVSKRLLNAPQRSFKNTKRGRIVGNATHCQPRKLTRR